MGKKIAIIQSNYIPWKGYFDIIAKADEFIVFDEVQYTHHDWRNRNKIKTPMGTQWLTVPVKVKVDTIKLFLKLKLVVQGGKRSTGKRLHVIITVPFILKKLLPFLNLFALKILLGYGR